MACEKVFKYHSLNSLYSEATFPKKDMKKAISLRIRIFNDRECCARMSKTIYEFEKMDVNYWLAAKT